MLRAHWDPVGVLDPAAGGLVVPVSRDSSPWIYSVWSNLRRSLISISLSRNSSAGGPNLRRTSSRYFGAVLYSTNARSRNRSTSPDETCRVDIGRASSEYWPNPLQEVGILIPSFRA